MYVYVYTRSAPFSSLCLCVHLYNLTRLSTYKFVYKPDLPLHLSVRVCVCVCLRFVNTGSLTIRYHHNTPNSRTSMWIFSTILFLPFESFVIALYNHIEEHGTVQRELIARMHEVRYFQIVIKTGDKTHTYIQTSDYTKSPVNYFTFSQFRRNYVWLYTFYMCML